MSNPEPKTLLREARKRLRLSQIDVAKRADVSKQAVSAWETGRALPPKDFLDGLLSEAGIQPPSIGGGAETESAKGIAKRDTLSPAFATPAQLRKLGLVRIPALTIEAGAGPPYEVTVEAVDEDGSGLIISEQQARLDFGVAADRLHTIRARGDSMIPTIFPGDEVFVAKVDAGSPLVDGAVYAIASPDGILIKRLRFSVDYADENRPKRWVHIVSDNPDVENYKVPADVFERDYRVVAAFLKVNRSL